MGVQGLLGTCLRHEDACCETADLIEVARQRQGIELLVDLNAFKNYILDVFWTKNSSLRGNVYFEMQGGEYKSLGLYVKTFVEVLKDKGIQLVFYVDGYKGSSRAGLNLKLDTWIARSTLRVSQLAEILDVCRGENDVVKVSKQKKIWPLNLGIELMAVLRTCNCEIHIAVGEADMVIAKALNDRHAFAVFTNDSDFCVMKHGRMIPFELFDIDKDLKLDEPMELPASLRKLKVKVITTDKVISMFQFEDHSQLVEMSIVAGNDYTGPFMRGYLRQQLGIRGPLCIEELADWIQPYKKVEDNEIIKREMENNPKFREAVHQSRNFYTLRMDCEHAPRKGDYSQLLEKGVRSGQYPCVLMGMHNNVYWYHTILEDNGSELLCSELVLRPLRTHIYRMVLPRDETEVLEQRMTPQGKEVKTIVTVGYKKYIPLLHKIKSGDLVNNMRAFHNIMSHFEKGDSPTNWFNRYGHKTGFIVYLLRYFLDLTWNRYIKLTENEFLALVALVFGQPDVSHYQATELRPSVRCVTILNWFQLLEKGVTSGQYPCVLMGMHNNVYWYHTTLEDDHPRRLCSEEVLRPLRIHIYRMVLPSHETEVLEKWMSPQWGEVKQTVKVGYKTYIPLLHKIKPGELANNLRAFHNIMSHFEKGDSPTNWFNRYGHKTGFIVYLLRYFLHLTWDCNIFLTENEFLALVALVFGQPDVSHYQATVLRPSVRCVTILNWFQNLYRHAYSMLGSLLYLQHEFPLPSELFSGAVWTALFMASSDDVEVQQGSPDFLRRTHEYIDNILKEKHVKGMTRKIAEGFFDYE